MCKERLTEAQNTDPSLAKYHHQAVKKEQIVKSPSFYYHDDVLIRFYRPPHLTVHDTWAERYQVVVPMTVRKSILEIAREGFGGHLGINKTHSKILDNFFWPKMKEDITRFINSCRVSSCREA